MSSYPTSTSATGIWQLGDIPLFIQDGAWPDATFERAVFGGGAAPGNSNIIDYITVSSLGNATDFGDLTVALGSMNSGENSSKTRGIFGGGYNAGVGNNNTVNFITFASTGNATDFGDLHASCFSLSACSSTTRGVFGGGADLSATNVIDFITLATTGNATDFGDLTVARDYTSACSSNTRGLWAGGRNGGTTNVIDYITIASTGNAVDFGDMTAALYNVTGTSSQTIGLLAGGYATEVTIQYVTIATTGNAASFGSLVTGQRGMGACSAAHGGL